MSSPISISNPVLSDVAVALGASVRAQEKSNKRRANRIGLKARVTISPYIYGVPQRPVTVDVRDLSARGISITRTEPMQPGQQFIVRLPRTGEKPTDILCTVAHCSAVQTNVYKIGAEFTCVVRPDSSPAPGREDPRELDRIQRSILS